MEKLTNYSYNVTVMHLLQIYLPETVQKGMLYFLLDKIAMCVHCHRERKLFFVLLVVLYQLKQVACLMHLKLLISYQMFYRRYYF